MGFLLCGRCRILHKSNATPAVTPSAPPIAHIETVDTQQRVLPEDPPTREEPEGISPPNSSVGLIFSDC